MEIIQSTTQSGISVINEHTKIKYSLSVKDGNIKSFTGQIVKNETIVGFCNANSAGVAGISVNEENNLTEEEFSAVLSQFAADRSNAFLTIL